MPITFSFPQGSNPGHAARGCRAVPGRRSRRRHGFSGIPRSPDIKPSDGDHGRIENQNLYSDPRCGLAPRNATNGRDYKASSWSRASAKSPGRAPRPTNSSARDALLHHFIAVDRRPTRAGISGPSPLDGRERPALGHGCDFPRRPMPHPHRSRPQPTSPPSNTWPST